MSEVVTVTVLQDDIDNGARRVAHRCPVARALCRELNLAVPLVTVWFLWADTPRGSLALPQEAADFVADFDAGRPVEPFKFEAELAAVAVAAR